MRVCVGMWVSGGCECVCRYVCKSGVVSVSESVCRYVCE